LGYKYRSLPGPASRLENALAAVFYHHQTIPWCTSSAYWTQGFACLRDLHIESSSALSAERFCLLGSRPSPHSIGQNPVALRVSS